MVKCPYCGNDDPDKFIHPDENELAYTICRNCDGEFESGEIEYYEAQSEEESEEDQLISLSAIAQALDYEIEWSRGNVHLAPNQNDADWFIKGLEQAKWLIAEIAKIGPLDPLPNSEDLPRKNPGWMGDYGGIPHGPFDM